MRKSKTDPHILDHLEWIAFVRPTGLVVSGPALVRAGAILDRRDIDGQTRLKDCLVEEIVDKKTGPESILPDFETFARSVLGWSFSPKGFAGTVDSPVPDDLAVDGGLIRPDFAVRELEPKDGAVPWQLLVNVYDARQDLDQISSGKGELELSPHGRMERLLRGTGVAAGILFNGRVVRLVSAPRGESSGWLDFKVADMSTTAGRPICSAMRMLLNQRRLLALPKPARLAALLENSRKYQNEVSERLAEQVLHALYELIRGFQAAHDASRGQLLRDVLGSDPDRVYRALLSVLLRIVFLLYAEERDMMPPDETWLRYYSLGGLHERLREDAAQHPDTMDQRFGAWAQLLVLFRMVYDGAAYGDVSLPKRHGDLFDPERFPLLEGRTGRRTAGEHVDIPHVPDGTIYRALEKLLVLDGERLSYRALDVEQIGSVYETMMGFRVEIATGISVAIKAEKRYGAPTTIDLDALLAEPSTKREKWLEANAGRKIPDGVKKAVKEALTLDDLHSALDKVIDKHATPDRVAKGSLVLQPSPERRRSGSHYTPRTLTEPIVRTTLEPILARLKGAVGSPPKPNQILDLKVCDPAMGSGAFLVEACRQLADSLLQSWKHHGGMPALPPDEDEVVFARRLIAQRCLYGVDKNPMAVDLAKVSLWLVTLAKDHSFTFLDHSLRCGDSLVGLTQEQIASANWKTTQGAFLSGQQKEALDRAAGYRREILAARDDVSYDELRRRLDMAEEALGIARFIGDSVIAAFFAGRDAKSREGARREVGSLLEQYFDKANPLEDARIPLDQSIANLRTGVHAIPPFHWHIEFPEVFAVDAIGKATLGFDAIVGNPPFAGKNTVAAGNRTGYTDWLLTVHQESHGNSDLVAHFYRRAFGLLRTKGTCGLIATNTIGQGDTRATGLGWICGHGGEVYNARKRVRWPGAAAVIVSVVHISNGEYSGTKCIDGRLVKRVSAYLFHRGGDGEPQNQSENAGKAFVGSYILGMGFTFDDTDTKGIATPICEMERLIAQNPNYGSAIFPYIGGEELNDNPHHSHHRYVINFGERTEEECRQLWPELMNIVELKVKPERDKLKGNPDAERRRENWWQYGRYTPALFRRLAEVSQVLAISRVGQHCLFAPLSSEMVFSDSLIVIPWISYACYASVQTRAHEVWARFFGSSMKDDLRYTPSDCFATFPFPKNWETDTSLQAAGHEYDEFRADLMIRNNEGLTKTYNRFHHPEERLPDILKLRELHAKMDRAVLDAYGWTDIPTDCEFILDYEEEDDDEGSGRRKKKPWRYRWPDDVRDEVLARLLELNSERAAAEERAGLTGKGKRASAKKATANGASDADQSIPGL